MPKQKSIQGKYSGILGQRYIFFSTLKNENEQLYTNAAAHFKNLNNNFMNKNEKDEDEVSNFMLNMIKMLDSIAQHTKQNEINYLLQQRQKILELKDIDSKLKEEIEKLIPNSTDAKWDYKTIILGLDKVRNKSAKYEESMQQFKEALQNNTTKGIFKDAKWLDELYTYENKKTGESTTKTYKDWYLTAYDVYRQAVLEKFGKVYQVPTLITSTLEKKYSQILTECLQSSSFLDNITTIFSTNNPKEITTIVQQLIVGEILKHPDIKDLSAYIIQKLNQNPTVKELSTVLSDQAEKVFAINGKQNKKLLTSLEEEALATGKNLADRILNSIAQKGRENELQDFLAKITNNDSALIQRYVDKIHKIQKYMGDPTLAKNVPNAKRQLTLDLKNEIFNYLKRELQITQDAALNEIRTYNSTERRQAIDKILTRLLNKNSSNTLTYAEPSVIQKSLQISGITAASWAEIISSPKNLSILQESFKHYIPGKAIQLKDDISFTVSFNPMPADFSFDSLFTEFNQDLEDFGKNLSTIYYNNTENNKQKGETNVEAAKKVYKRLYGSLSQQYSQIINEFGRDSKQFERFNDYLQNNFLGAVSVKEYQFYNNDLGFEGGSLGGDNNAIVGIENIYKMYDAGGLKPIDIDVIIEATLNCAPGMVARDTTPDLIENIKNYLIGGAAMMMFDEGFAMSKEFLQQLKAEFHTDLQLNHIFLYQFNTLYVPASYVIKNISENLKKFYNILEGERETFKTKSSIEFVNPITVNDIPSSETMPLAQDRWNEVSKKAQESVSIHVLLMAGLLDMFENLPELINPIT